MLSVSDPDLQIAGGGGCPDPEIRGGCSPKKGSAHLSSVWSKNKEGRCPPPGPSPGSGTGC